MLTVQNLTFKRGDSVIFKEISVTLPQGSLTCLIGKSGAGKTTLLECIAQLNTKYTGSILFNGVDLKTMRVEERSKMLGLVFQQGNLFPHLTVLENCMQPLQVVLHVSKESAQEIAHLWLDELDMLPYKIAYPGQLSGGQQQRVAIARSLCMRPQLLCLDEPTSALDKENMLRVVSLLKKINAEGTTIIAVSHDESFIQALDATILRL